jgi:Sulfotransferase domain
MFKDKRRTGVAKISSKFRGIIPAVNKAEIFPTDVLFHYTYHKCLTVYFTQITRHLGYEFHFPVTRVATQVSRLHDLINSTQNKQYIVLHNLHELDYSNLPTHRGSHIVRDPRDIIVSAYYYHRWTKEPWCIDPKYDWNMITSNSLFSDLIHKDKSNWPVNVSYQNYLLTLDKELGIILEMLRNDAHFKHMRNWDYDNPDFIEIKYEDIIGNEVDIFEKIFKHYNLHPKLIDRGLYYVDYFSMKNKAKGKKSHVRSGKKKQWETELSPRILAIFEEQHSDLLSKLGYK